MQKSNKFNKNIFHLIWNAREHIFLLLLGPMFERLNVRMFSVHSFKIEHLLIGCGQWTVDYGALAIHVYAISI